MFKIQKEDNVYKLCRIIDNDTEYEKEVWATFYWEKCFDLAYETCGYFDNRPRIRIGLFFFMATIMLPFRNKWTDECESPKYGIAIHNNTFWLYTGGKGNLGGGRYYLTWNIPFFTKHWVRTSILLNDNTWFHDTYKNKHTWDYMKEKESKKMTWNYAYTDSFDNEIIPTTITLEEREWRPKWLMWTNLFAETRKSIDISFSKEVGKRKGSYKGGVLGCSYELKPNETPLDCIKRMEKERTF